MATTSNMSRGTVSLAVIALVMALLAVGDRWLVVRPALADRFIDDAWCTSANCSSVPQAQWSSADCIFDNVCNLSQSGGAIVYCATLQNNSCRIPSPVTINICSGLCNVQSAYGCEVKWTVCGVIVGPPQP